MVYYLSKVNQGLISCGSLGDGYTINLKWAAAYPSTNSNKVAYNIYMSTDENAIFDEGVKYVATDGYTEANILDLSPGQLYHFAVRAVEYDNSVVNPNQLPSTFSNLKVYSQSLLRNNISDTEQTIPLIDTSDFPSYGIISVGVEFIRYLSNDTFNNNLVLTNFALQRGYLNTIATIHNTDGYDGYATWIPPFASYILGREETNTKIFPCQNRFDIKHYQFTTADGYHQTIKDLLTTDLSGSDEYNENFNSYDYGGWHRTDPVQLLNGECVGSYIGGEQGCIDQYGNMEVYRGLSVQEQNNQRQELLLSVTGEPVVLIKRMWTGITCDCFTPGQEYPADRCPKCHGSKFVVGYEQYFNERRSDRRIMVRFSPGDEDLKMQEAGLESDLQVDVWTLTVPTIKDRDILVRFDQNGNEEFRYEVLTVNRNRTISSLEGGQKMRVQRIRKFDPAYQIRVFRDASMFPSVINTSSVSTNGIPAHSHTITRNEKDPSTWSQTTGIAFGHNHPVYFENGQLVVKEVLGHGHTIVFP